MNAPKANNGLHRKGLIEQHSKHETNTHIRHFEGFFLSLHISIGLCSCRSVCVFLFASIHAVTSPIAPVESSFAKCTSNISYYWTGLVTVPENCFQMNQTSLFSLIDTTAREKAALGQSTKISNVQLGRQLWIYIEIKFSSKCVQSSWHKCCSQLVRARALINTHKQQKHQQNSREGRGGRGNRCGGGGWGRKKSFSPKLTKDKLIENRKKGSDYIGRKCLQNEKDQSVLSNNNNNKKNKKKRSNCLSIGQINREENCIYLGVVWPNHLRWWLRSKFNDTGQIYRWTFINE